VEGAFLTVALTLLCWRSRIFENYRFTVLEHIARRSWRAPVYIFLLALLLRGVLLPTTGIPAPRVHDENSYLLMGDTFAHFRLTNPTPPAWEHFETFHENMVPTYQSKYPVAQGVVLAFGELVFGQPWAGIFLSAALMAAAITWALQAFVPHAWAFLGGVLCVLHLCVVGYWVDSYWGGTVPALGGALALGGAVRLIRSDTTRRAGWYNGAAFGVGLAILATSRPFEGLCFSLPLLGTVAWTIAGKRENRGERIRASAVSLGIVALSISAVLFYNWRCTGSPLQMPYDIYQQRYGTTPLFLWGSPHAFPSYNHRLIANFYEEWAYSFYRETRTWQGILISQFIRDVQLWAFLVQLSLTIPLAIGIAISLMKKRFRIILWCALGTFIAYSAALFYQPHYFAPATVTVYALVVIGTWKLWSNGSPGLHALAGTLCLLAVVFALIEASDTVYIEPPEATLRQLVTEWVGSVPGKHLVLVQYAGTHQANHELVFNQADFSSAKILWAREMSPRDDAELCVAYPDRKFWELETNDNWFVVRPLNLCQQSR
jgi:hypothetical protein